MRKTIDRKDVTTELIEDASEDINRIIRRFESQLDNYSPRQVFQEKHTSGKWLNKNTWYTYWIYSEGRMLQLNIDSLGLVKFMEKGK